MGELVLFIRITHRFLLRTSLLRGLKLKLASGNTVVGENVAFSDAFCLIFESDAHIWA